MQVADRLLRRADKQHQQRAWIAFPYAAMKKFGDDQAGNLAALIAYYGFLSLFPLMMVLVTLLGLLLRNNPSCRTPSEPLRSPTSPFSEDRSPATSTRSAEAVSPSGSAWDWRCGQGSE